MPCGTLGWVVVHTVGLWSTPPSVPHGITLLVATCCVKQQLLKLSYIQHVQQSHLSLRSYLSWGSALGYHMTTQNRHCCGSLYLPQKQAWRCVPYLPRTVPKGTCSVTLRGQGTCTSIYSTVRGTHFVRTVNEQPRPVVCV